MLNTGIFYDKCPNCGNEQTALIGYKSNCNKCHTEWFSYRNIKTQPIIGFHPNIREDGIENIFISLNKN
jgi:hypothetical protein